MRFGENKVKIREIDNKIKYLSQLTIDELAKLFNCDVEEVLIGDFLAKNYDYEECPYKVIVGFANFEDSKMKEGKLETIIGRPLKEGGSYLTNIDGHINYLALNTKKSAIINCQSIKNIYGSWIINQDAETLGSVQNIYGSLYLNNTKVKDTGELKLVGSLSIDDSHLSNLNIDHIGKLICTTNTYVKNFDNVKKIDDVMFDCDFIDLNIDTRVIRSRLIKEAEEVKKNNLTRLIIQQRTLKSREGNVYRKRIDAFELKRLFEANFTYDGVSWLNCNYINTI